MPEEMVEGTFENCAVSRGELLDVLASDAEYFRPRLFAVYGIYSDTNPAAPGEPFLGWGMEHPAELGALFWYGDRSGTHRAGSADAVLALHRRIGEAHMKWLD